MAPRSPDRPVWFVGVQHARDKAPVGAGFLFADGHIVTCAHVVADAIPAEPPSGRLWALFAFCDGAQAELAVLPEGWFPDDDIAVLRLVGAAPEGAAPARLASSRALSGHACTAHGYPRGQEWEATPARVAVAGLTDRSRISVTSGSDLGFSFEGGYSGSPLWDHAIGAVIGMVAQRVRPRAAVKGGAERDIRTAFALSVDRIGERWPALAARVEDLGAGGEGEDSFEFLAELLDAENRPPLVREADIYDLGVSVSKYTRAGRTRRGAAEGGADGADGAAAPGGTGPAADSEASDEYIPRPGIDEALDRAFAEHDFIIAVGDSASGKSRSMVELLRRRASGSRVLVPIAEPTGPARLSRLDLGRADASILWLDDIHRFLGLNGIDLKTLDRFRRQNPPIKIVGTLTEKRLREIQSRRGEDNASRMPSLVLNRAATVRIASLPDSEELVAARRHYPDEDFSARGIGQTLVAAGELDEMLLAGRTAEPFGWAVLQAAVDWQRTGLDTAVSRRVLRRLTEVYLDEDRRAGFGDEEFARGLAWATTAPAGSVVAPVLAVRAGTAAGTNPDNTFGNDTDTDTDGGPATGTDTAFGTGLDTRTHNLAADTGTAADTDGGPRTEVSIEPGAATGYRAYDYVVEVASGYRDTVAGWSVPRAAWDIVVAECTGADLLRVAFSLLLAGEEDYAWSAAVALAAAEKAAATSADDPETGAYAQLLQGYLQGRAGNQERAIQLLEAAERSGIADVEAAAHLELAGVLVLTGELDRAEEMLQAAMASAGDPATVAIAQAGLASVMYQKGYVDQALTLLEGVLSADDPASAEAAGTMLAEIVGGSARGGAGGDGKALVPHAAGWQPSANLVRQAVQPIGAVPVAAVALSGILMEQGDLGRARALLQRAYESRDFQSGPIIEAALGALATADGSPDEAEGFLRAAVDSGDFVASTMARVTLAQLALGSDDRPAARAMLEPVAGGGHSYYGPMAAALLGDLLLQDGEREAGLAMLDNAYAAGRSRWHYAAGHSLAMVYLLEDDSDEHGRALLAEAADSPFRDVSARAADVMGDLLSSRGEVEAARQYYWDAINSEDPFWSPMARTDLAILVADQDSDFDAAAELLAGATGARDAAVSGRAHLLYGLVDLERGRLAEGIAWLHAAADCEYDGVGEPAHVYLAAGVAMESGELSESVEILDRLWRRIDEEEGTSPGDGSSARSADQVSVGDKYLGFCDRFIELGEVGYPYAGALLDVIVTDEIPSADIALRSGAALRYGRLLAGTEDLGRASDLLQRVVGFGHGADGPAALLLLGDVLVRQGDLDAAHRCLISLVTGVPGQIAEEDRRAAFRLLSEVATAQDRPAEAARWSAAAAEGRSDDAWQPAPDGFVDLASPVPAAGSFEILGDQSFEIVGERFAVPGEPLSPTVLYLLGRVAVGEGLPEEAQRWFDAARAGGDADVALRARDALAELSAEAGEAGG